MSLTDEDEDPNDDDISEQDDEDGSDNKVDKENEVAEKNKEQSVTQLNDTVDDLPFPQSQSYVRDGFLKIDQNQEG